MLTESCSFSSSSSSSNCPEQAEDEDENDDEEDCPNLIFRQAFRNGAQMAPPSAFIGKAGLMKTEAGCPVKLVIRH